VEGEEKRNGRRIIRNCRRNEVEMEKERIRGRGVETLPG